MFNPVYTSETLHWHGIAIEIRFCRAYSAGMAHLEINAHGQPLPVTETGYRSLFLPAEAFDRRGGPLAYVREGLADAALSPDWHALQAARQQLSLF